MVCRCCFGGKVWSCSAVTRFLVDSSAIYRLYRSKHNSCKPRKQSCYIFIFHNTGFMGNKAFCHGQDIKSQCEYGKNVCQLSHARICYSAAPCYHLWPSCVIFMVIKTFVLQNYVDHLCFWHLCVGGGGLKSIFIHLHKQLFWVYFWLVISCLLRISLSFYIYNVPGLFGLFFTAMLLDVFTLSY